MPPGLFNRPRVVSLLSAEQSLAKGALLRERRSVSEPVPPGDASSTNLAGLLKGLV